MNTTGTEMEIKIAEKNINPNSILTTNDTNNIDDDKIIKNILFNKINNSNKNTINITVIDEDHFNKNIDTYVKLLKYTHDNPEYKTSLEPVIIKIRELQETTDHLKDFFTKNTDTEMWQQTFHAGQPLSPPPIYFY